MNVDMVAYEAWKKNLLQELPITITCPDCEGNGEGLCSCCGNERDCETCGGDGEVEAAAVLDIRFYKRVRQFDEMLLVRWALGLPLVAGSIKEPAVLPQNPLMELMEGEPGFNPFSSSYVKLVLCIPKEG